ncbi:lipoprotein signal peptide [Mycobacterium marinum]|uniref:alpha/beta hydrolase family protein n=1 Tax=Mycobacterium marinum TaxID=1781 RepID=UPI0023583C66|nr:lipoprotein signal peptide [Mycobacterium marinum]MDC8980953.1 lipoprotein signal peptide [Mycobacterium marinum]MDC8999263.1 lipoprotein signal peptide [Mycobacterium marinum]MDC9009834.1 lipoprotein signal peptide [Mycobacterium marinum]
MAVRPTMVSLLRVLSVVSVLSAAVWLAAGCGTGVRVNGQTPSPPVGLRQIEFVDPRGPDGPRRLAVSLFYPAEQPSPDDRPFAMPFATELSFYPDLPPRAGGSRLPLILLSHGRGSNGLFYAWLAQALASKGYLVAALNHYRANTYDSSIVYLANKLWQRPRDLSLTADFLVQDPFWGPLIDASRIGVAGHSQGGFTSLWLGGARVNPDRYLDFQRGVQSDPAIPAYLRTELPVDAGPALDVADSRIKAVFAMAPGMVKDFGMDADGLHQLRVPTYIIVGAHDAQTPPGDNAEFAAANVPGAQLNVLPGKVGHEIFLNECNQLGREQFPEACIDDPSVDRHLLHAEISSAATTFFDTQLR